MTAYLRRGGGKQQELRDRRAETLVQRIASGRPPGELSEVAEELRLAELQLIKAMLHELDPGRAEDMTPETLGRIQKYQEQAAVWKRLTAEEIIGLYS